MRNDFLKHNSLRILCSLLFTNTMLIGNAQNMHAKDNEVFETSNVNEDSYGRIVDSDGKPLSGALITILNSEMSTTTSFNGEYIIPFKKGMCIRVDYIGFYSKEVKIDHPGKLDIRLDENICIQNEDVVMLYSNCKVDEMIASYSRVEGKVLGTTPETSLDKMLTGRMTRVHNNSESGKITADEGSVNLSVLGGAGTLVLVDGIERPFSSLDPEEIESVTVLKDALGTVLLGQRSANNVINVVTKHGKVGAPRISFTAECALFSPTALPDVLNGYDNAVLYNQALLNDGRSLRYNRNDFQAFKDGSSPYTHPDVDWYDTVLREHGVTQRYNFNVNGGGSGVRYFVSLDYMNKQGLFKQNSQNSYSTQESLRRYLVRSNVDVKLNKNWDLNVGLFGRIQDGNTPGSDPEQIFKTLMATPSNAYAVFNPDGSFGGTVDYKDSWANPLVQSQYSGYNTLATRDLLFDVSSTYRLDDLVEGLYIGARGSYNNVQNVFTNRSKQVAVYEGIYSAGGEFLGTTKYGNDSDQKNESNSQKKRQTITYVEGKIGYDRTFDMHTVGGLFLLNEMSTTDHTGGYIPYIYTNYGVSLNYDYNKTYFIELAGSRSGYNRFAKSHKYGNFGAAGISWIVSNEDWFKPNVINFLKFRATYGLNGNANPTGDFGYIQNYNTNGGQWYYWGGNNIYSSRIVYEDGIANENEEWEKAKRLNIGLDLKMFSNQLSLTAEYYQTNRFDVMGVRSNAPDILGNSYPQENLQKIKNFGGEVSLLWNSKVRDFNYYIGANMTVDQSELIYFDELVQTQPYKVRTGHPNGVRQGLIALGLFQTQEEIDEYYSQYDVSTLKPGDIKYLDRNGDKKIDSEDEGLIGSEKPNIWLNTTLGFSYKGFDVSALFTARLNREIYLSGDKEYAFSNLSSGVKTAYEHHKNSWSCYDADGNIVTDLDKLKEMNANATSPRLTVGSNANNSRTSTYWQRNGNFVRLKSFEIGYTLPYHLTKNVSISSVRFYVNGSNLFTYSPFYKYRDDLDIETLYGYPAMRTINFGTVVKF